MSQIGTALRHWQYRFATGAPRHSPSDSSQPIPAACGRVLFHGVSCLCAIALTADDGGLLGGEMKTVGHREPYDAPVPPGTDPGEVAVAIVDSGINDTIPGLRAAELKRAILAQARPSPHHRKPVARAGWIPYPNEDGQVVSPYMPCAWPEPSSFPPQPRARPL